MIRLTWRQFRAQAYVAAGALVIAAVVVAVTGLRLAHLYGSILQGRCGSEGCGGATDVLDSGGFFYLRQGIRALVLVVPALIGMFWGAPLVARELETGTCRLAWTQSVTRRRWLAVKLTVLGLASMAAGVLLGLMASWWARPYDLATRFIGGRFAPGQFEVQGIVTAGYAVFAFAAAVTVGVLIRRTLLAMAASLAVFAGTRYAIRTWVRPHLITPARLSLPLNYGGRSGFQGTGKNVSVVPGSPSLPGAWIYSVRAVDKAGHAPTRKFIHSACPGLQMGGQGGPAGRRPPAAGGGQGHCAQELATKLHGLFIYQPGGRYWLFQIYETAIFTGLALLLALFCLWWIHHGVSGTRWQAAWRGSGRSAPADGHPHPGNNLYRRPVALAEPGVRQDEPSRRACGRRPAGRAPSSVIRLTWRQFRAQAQVAAATLMTATVLVTVTGPRLAHLYDTTVAACSPPNAPRCYRFGGVVSSDFYLLGQALWVLVLIAPALTGMFWGAPLVARELETGTCRLAWTQSVTRQRWLAAKLTVPGLAAVATAGLLGLMAGWWAGPHNLVGTGRFVPGQFGEQGIVPAGYAAFAFAAGVTAGLLIRRTLPATAAALAVFVGARYIISRWVRPHFAVPLHLNVRLTYQGDPLLTPTRGGLAIDVNSPTLPNAWLYGVRAVNKAGHPPHTPLPPARLLQPAENRAYFSDP